MKILRKMLVLLFLASFVWLAYAAIHTPKEDTKCTEFKTWQTSAKLLFSYSSCKLENKDTISRDDELRHLLLQDINIKAGSYAILNKVFFFFSILFGVLVLLWPSIGIIFKKKIEEKEKYQWVRAATVQTTVTALAALMFAFYIQYKEKQTFAETLMRSVLFSTQSTAELNTIVTEELSRIDSGFSFNSIIGENGEE